MRGTFGYRIDGIGGRWLRMAEKWINGMKCLRGYECVIVGAFAVGGSGEAALDRESRDIDAIV
jgi:hypothetical protein